MRKSARARAEGGGGGYRYDSTYRKPFHHNTYSAFVATVRIHLLRCVLGAQLPNQGYNIIWRLRQRPRGFCDCSRESALSAS